MSLLRQSRLWAFFCFVAVFLTAAGPASLCACASVPVAQMLPVAKALPLRMSQPRPVAPAESEEAPCCPACLRAQAKTGHHPCSAPRQTAVHNHDGSHGAGARPASSVHRFEQPCACQHDESPSIVAVSTAAQTHLDLDGWAVLPALPMLAAPASMRREFVLRGHDPPRRLASSNCGSRAPPNL